MGWISWGRILPQNEAKRERERGMEGKGARRDLDLVFACYSYDPRWWVEVWL